MRARELNANTPSDDLGCIRMLTDIRSRRATVATCRVANRAAEEIPYGHALDAGGLDRRHARRLARRRPTLRDHRWRAVREPVAELSTPVRCRRAIRAVARLSQADTAGARAHVVVRRS